MFFLGQNFATWGFVFRKMRKMKKLQFLGILYHFKNKNNSIIRM
jgi:hypothetical protein